jgi:hypothetical protein
VWGIVFPVHLSASYAKQYAAHQWSVFPSRLYPCEVRQSSTTRCSTPFRHPQRSADAMKCKDVSTTTLGKRPVAVNNLNGESFQQDVLVTYNGRSSRQPLIAYADDRLAVLRRIHRSCGRRTSRSVVSQTTTERSMGIYRF